MILAWFWFGSSLGPARSYEDNFRTATLSEPIVVTILALRKPIQLPATPTTRS